MADASYISRTEIDTRVMEAGCHAMRLDTGRRTVHRQQRELLGVLGAGHRFNSILMPRRSTKTTSLFAWALGTCLTYEDEQIAYMAGTSAKSARDRFTKDIIPALERTYPDEASRPFKIRRGSGMERVIFDNGSQFQVMGATDEDLRGNAYTRVIVDECQELDHEDGEIMLAALLPVLDTNPDGQVIMAGTAGQRRDGQVLWDQLERGRAGDGGVLEYAADQRLALEDYDEWEKVIPLLEAHHPGIGTLTTLEVIKGNYDRMRDKHRFAREYLGVWGNDGSSAGIFDIAGWNTGARDADTLPAPPERFAIGFACSPYQSSAAIVAAWRENGTAVVLLLDHRNGTRWLRRRAADLALKYKVPLHYDGFGQNLIEADEIKRTKPRPTMAPFSTRDSTSAAMKLVEEVRDGNVAHYGQDALTASIVVARRRNVGAKAFAYGRGDTLDDIAAVEAASVALWAYDQLPTRTKVRVLRPSA